MKSLLNMLNKHFLLLGVFSLLVVSCNLGTQGKDFLKRNAQDTSERNIVKSLTNQERVALGEVDLQDVSRIRSNSKLLAINDWRKKQILLIDKKTLNEVERIEFKTGRGPGELIHFTGFSITNDHLYVIDEVNSKLLKLNFEGGLIEEFSIKRKPHRITSLNSGRLVLFSPSSPDNLLNIFRTSNNSTYKLLADIQQEQNNMLSYEGVISGQENKIYFAGYSEPIIKKIDSDGNVIFSKSTIDNYDTSANYAKTQSGDLSNNLLSYTPGALFSSLDLDVCDESLFIIPHYNDDESFKYLDLYSSSDGKYLETYTTDHFLTSLTVDSASIYAITVGDGTKFLSKFDNPARC